MLPMPELDEQSFEQLTANAKKMIHKFNSQWTDENHHDPGITFIELFAWLAELQQYYMSRVTERHFLKFLKLLGEKPREASCSRVDVLFSNMTEALFIPGGTKLAAEGLTFETAGPVYALPAVLDRIIAVPEFEAYDYTSANTNEGVTYYAFGKAAGKGSRLYIGFDKPLPSGKPLAIRIDVYEDYPVAAENGEDGRSSGAYRQGIVPSARVSWKYYGVNGGKPDGTGAWLPVSLIADETLHMTYSGYIQYRIPAEMKPLKLHPANDKGRYWLCCTLEEEGFETPPRIHEICINTVSALHKETYSEVIHFSGSGAGIQTFELDNYLSLYGCLEVQAKDNEGNWRRCSLADGLSPETLAASETPAYSVKAGSGVNKTGIVFNKEVSPAVPPKGRDNIRAICYSEAFRYSHFLGRSNGTPGQAFKIPVKDVLARGMRLQVGKRERGLRDYIWQDWKLVADFDASGPSDRHFVYSPQTGEILFGDNENGAIPEADDAENICLIALEAGGGAAGNISGGRIGGFREERECFKDILVWNKNSGAGGRDGESLEKAKYRIGKALKAPHRTVTDGDYEAIALDTPGLRIARAKAIPLFEPGMKDYPQKKAPGQVTVIVVPYSEQEKPTPSAGFMETVKRHLNKHRLLTTQVHVAPPEYVKITVGGLVITSSRLKPAAGDIEKVLRDLLHPLDRDGGRRGWPFGQTVFKSDIYSAVNKLEGVAYVKELWLNAEGKGILQADNGDIHIPPHGLVYSGEHEIEVISMTDI